MNKENFLQSKNPTEWFSGHHTQESTNQEQVDKYKKSYHYPGLS